MYFDYSDSPKEHWIYYAGKYIARLLTFVVYRKLTVKGKENIPLSGALIIASNHIAFSDPAIIIANCPRTVHFMAKSELFEKPLKALFMKKMNAFPVKRNNSDRSALRRARDVISRGWVLGIFPEGRRVRNSPPSYSKKGVAYLARISGADILPVCIYRAPDDTSRWHSLVLSFGEIIKNSELCFDDKKRSSELDKASEMIMEKIKDLWEAENEGYSS